MVLLKLGHSCVALKLGSGPVLLKQGRGDTEQADPGQGWGAPPGSRNPDQHMGKLVGLGVASARLMWVTCPSP